MHILLKNCTHEVNDHVVNFQQINEYKITNECKNNRLSRKRLFYQLWL